jgi:putative sterol carrier protein
MAHEFLSDGWFEAVGALEAPPTPAAMQGVIINMIVTRDGGDIEAHMGEGTIQKGLAEGAGTTITTPYEVAKSLFVKRDQAAAMQAFMSGQIKVAGDMTKLMAMGQVPPSAEADAYGAKIIELTEA